MKNSNDTNRNRTRDLPACSTAPQPTSPPCTPMQKWEDNIFKPTIGKERLHQVSNDNGVRIVNFTTSKNLLVKSTMFQHQNIHKYNWTSPDGKTHNQIDHILTNKRWLSSILDV